MSTEPSAAKAPRAPRAKPKSEPRELIAPGSMKVDNPPAPEQPLAHEAWLLALLWHYRHQAGNALACVISDKEVDEMRASFAYTKQDATVVGVNKHGRLIVSVVERNTRMLDPKTGALISAGNEVRPCESTVDGGEQARRAAERASLAGRAQEMAQRLLGEERSGNYSAESMREAARLLDQLSEAVR